MFAFNYLNYYMGNSAGNQKPNLHLPKTRCGIISEDFISDNR